MLTQTFETLEKCYDRDVYETIDDAVEIGVIHWEQGARLCYEKSRGMQFCNPRNVDIERCDVCGIHFCTHGHKQDEEETTYFCDICGNELDYEPSTKDAQTYACMKCRINE